jgi:hypothetical protein
MYFIVAFHPTGLLKKKWVRNEGQVINLLKEGFIVYRCGTDQVAKSFSDHRIMWLDLKEDIEDVGK